jgi:hypothetical protein
MVETATAPRLTRDSPSIALAIQSPRTLPLTQAVQSNWTLSNMLPHAG